MQGLIRSRFSYHCLSRVSYLDPAPDDFVAAADDDDDSEFLTASCVFSAAVEHDEVTVSAVTASFGLFDKRYTDTLELSLWFWITNVGFSSMNCSPLMATSEAAPHEASSGDSFML